ncbi:MAG: bifunctional hydroxymethylpyrimidine kinase/phosphomethylpyrimidine kinase [Alphaproteobacteria bacterium]|jgi:hydroxymethylpyrimidine/phosphomethylpyrimidine kinase|nr:bifunctional hydroxymethylpyrimidine kinase/phosphomethylpyrimidine kinase [Alphaproteobacteria bacterium]
MIPNVLTIAGSDPSGGAGIQADLKAFSALGAYGMAALTALTAQNTRAVTGIHPVPPDFIAAQIDAIFADVRVDALKIGMVGVSEAVAAVAERLAAHRAKRVVLDPVMVAKSGDRLLDENAVMAVRERLVPLAELITPNLPEAGVLLDRPAPEAPEAMREAARALHALGPRLVLLKGGHLAGTESFDLLYDGDDYVELPARRIATRNTHGTGCTLSAAIAALLPRHGNPAVAVAEAKTYVTAAIAAADRLSVGHGHGPVHHFHALWPAPPAA